MDVSLEIDDELTLNGLMLRVYINKYVPIVDILAKHNYALYDYNQQKKCFRFYVDADMLKELLRIESLKELLKK